MIALSADLVNSVDVIIMGASTRAAAFSALRAGLHPVCLDAYADADTRAHVPVQQVNDYPDGLRELLAGLPRLPLIYTGGLENRPDLLEFAADQHELWGNPAATVARARDPLALAEAARLARMQLPAWRNEDNPPPPDGTWLLRPRGGSGGRGIVPWTESQADSPTLQEPHLFQERISGIPFSAVFIASPLAGDVRFVGMTRQLVAEPECHARNFQWCGNIGPMALSVGAENLVRRFGNVLKWKLGLLGLFGVDMVITERGDPYVLEVNPRYPASLELLEHATGQPLLLDHCRCFTEAELPPAVWKQAHPGEFLGKAVYYSPIDLALEHPLADAVQIPFDAFPAITDLPPSGTFVRQGDPLCTVFAESFSHDQTWSLLKTALHSLEEQLGIAGEDLSPPD